MASNAAFDVEVSDSYITLTTKGKEPISVNITRGHDGEVVISHDTTEELIGESPTRLSIGRRRRKD